MGGKMKENLGHKYVCESWYDSFFEFPSIYFDYFLTM